MNLIDYVSLYPSVAAVIIAVLAVWVTFQTPSTMKAKVLWMGAFGFFAITSIIAMIWQQNLLRQKQINDDNIAAQKQASADLKSSQAEKTYRDNESTHLQNEAYLKGQNQAILTLLSKSGSKDAADKLAGAFSKFSEKLQRQNVNSKPEKPLKQRALELSQKILTFFDNRESLMPITTKPLSTTEEINEYNKKYFTFEKETINIYSIDFASEALEIHNEFEVLGLTSSSYEDSGINYQHPFGFVDIRIIGEALAKLAKKL